MDTILKVSDDNKFKILMSPQIISTLIAQGREYLVAIGKTYSFTLEVSNGTSQRIKQRFKDSNELTEYSVEGFVTVVSRQKKETKYSLSTKEIPIILRVTRATELIIGVNDNE